jgi:hypothetical protein
LESRTDALAHIITDVQATRQLLEKVPALAHAQASFHLKMERDAQKRSDVALQEFRENAMNSAKVALTDRVASAVVRQEDMVPVPFASGVAFEFAPNAADTCEQAFCYIEKHRGATKLGSAFDKDWARRHAMVKEDGLAPVPLRPALELEQDKCREAGVCLCSNIGMRIKAFFKKVCNGVLKPTCKPGSQARALLTGGSLVLGLLSVEKPGKGVKVRDLEAPKFIEHKELVHWYHIGLQYLSPYKPCFHVLIASAKPPLMATLIPLRASGTFPSTHQELAELDLDRFWWGALFRIWESRHPLSDVEPAEVAVRSFSDPVLIWTANKRRGHVREDGGGELPELPPPALEDVRGDDADEGGEYVPSSVSSQKGDDDVELRDKMVDEMMCLLSDTVDDEGAVGAATTAPTDDEFYNAADGVDVAFEAAAMAPVAEGRPGSSSDVFGLVAPPPAPPAHDADLPPLPPPVDPPLPPALGARGPRDAGLEKTKYRGGHITYYPNKGGKEGGRFQCCCPNVAGHGNRCRITRTSLASARHWINPEQGRPLGVMAAWLASSFEVETAEEHGLFASLLSYADRAEHRGQLMLEDNGVALSRWERPLWPDEPAEPEQAP